MRHAEATETVFTCVNNQGPYAGRANEVEGGYSLYPRLVNESTSPDVVASREMRLTLITTRPAEWASYLCSTHIEFVNVTVSEKIK